MLGSLLAEKPAATGLTALSRAATLSKSRRRLAGSSPSSAATRATAERRSRRRTADNCPVVCRACSRSAREGPLAAAEVGGGRWRMRSSSFRDRFGRSGAVSGGPAVTRSDIRENYPYHTWNLCLMRAFPISRNILSLHDYL